VITEPDVARLVERLEAIAGRESVRPVLVPVTDRFIEFLIDRHEALGRSFDFPASYRDGSAAALMDKDRFYASCERLGLPYPRMWTVTSPEDGRRVAPEILFPAILKPSLVHLVRSFLRGRKVIVARDAGEFRRVLDRLPFDASPWLAQEIVAGPDSNIHVFAGYFDRTGEAVRTFTARKLRQFPPGFGSASLAVGEEHPMVRDLSVSFLRSMGYTGLCGAEFKLDARDGRLVAIEINPRPALWFQLAHASGVSLVEAAVQDLAGLPVPSARGQRDGVQWRYLGRDLASALAYRLGRATVVPPPDTTAAVGRRTWPVWDARDPLPSLAEPLSIAARAWQRRRPAARRPASAG
jgi:predicted ATP-grasp superfamily ATP-dependent carboligase